MIQLRETSSGVRALDHANVEVSVRARGWRAADRGASIPRPTDAVVDGDATELRFPSAFVSATGREAGETYYLGSETGPVELPADDYLLDIGTGLKTYVTFEGAATLRKTGDFEELVVSFPERRAVTIGFRSRHEHPAGTVTMAPTPEGLATALSHLHSSLKTTGPDRSFPTLRGHPPLLETGEETAVPDPIAETTADTGIELVVPPVLEQLFVLAPLSFYLQATVRTADVPTPVLRAPDADLEVGLPSTPDLQDETADLLRHVFFLDAMVRNVGPHGTDLREADALEATDLDPRAAYEASPAERLSAYLSVPRSTVDAHAPDWHLSTYVEPTVERARSLPFLLEKLSLVYLPATSELTGSELLERSLDDFYRGARTDKDVASVDVVKPNLQRGRVHAWLADGIPIDVFKATHAAFENRLDYLERGGDGIRVAVVLNDGEMEEEHEDVARIYRERSEDLPMDVTVHEHLGRADLADVFAAEHDFVHYIGHCDAAGLRCPDGNLSVADLDASSTRTFFLNACGSYYEGMSLLEKGSVAGAVTFNKVLDRQAATVGTTFARLLVHGFSFARAMNLARRRIMTGKDYAVVGDGTYSLTQNRSLEPSEFAVAETEDGYELTMEVFSPGVTGGIYHLTFEEFAEEGSHLCGNASTYRLGADQLSRLLGQSNDPVLYDGEFYWSTELADLLFGDG